MLALVAARLAVVQGGIMVFDTQVKQSEEKSLSS